MKKKREILFPSGDGMRLRLRKMKLTFLLTFLVIASFGNSFSQVTLSLNFKKANISEVLATIEQKTDYIFLYKDDVLHGSNEISVDFENAKFDEVLKSICEQSNVDYEVRDRQIILKEKTVVSVQSDLQQPQKKEIAGIVTDSKGMPIPGATVIVKGTTTGITTNVDGKFQFSIPADAQTLVFSFVGMKSQEVAVAGKATFVIALEDETFALAEVVAIGYGTQTRREISGSVTNVTAKDFNKGVMSNAADLLQGKVAGLNITQGSGDVTNGPTIRLRGTSSLTGASSPFVVIDGVPGGDLISVSPQDIESISILKDASSAAIYGSRSASGVILITTKKGSKTNTKVSYEGYVGIDEVTNKPEMLNGAEWRKYAQDKNLSTAGFDLGADTDWFGEIMRTGVTQSHSVSMSGGGDDHNYMASASYLDMQGVVKGNDMNRFNFRFSFNQSALDNKLQLSFTGNAVIGNNSPTDDQNFVLAYNTIPVVPVKLANGEWYDNTDFDQGNPVRNIELNQRDNKENKFYANIKADLEIFQGLNFTASGFRERNTNDWGMYNNSTTSSGRNDLGFAQRQSRLWNKSLFETTLRFKRTFNDVHNVTALAGYSWEQNDYSYFGAQSLQFTTDLLGYNNLQSGIKLRPGDVYSNRNMSRLISSFARFTYNYKEKYVFAATVRRDGSSKFGANNKWGTFPSFSAAWNITGEEFMSNISAVNDLKFRVGYGITGNQDGIDPYRSLSLYGQSGKYYDDGAWLTAYDVNQNPNPKLKWEKTAMFNIGLDFALLKSRIYGTLEWYDKTTSDLLYVYSVPVPPYAFGTMLSNVGEMSNKGIELSLNAIPVKTQDFQWTIGLVAAHNKNMVTKLSNEDFKLDRVKSGTAFIRGGSSTTTHILEVGQEVGTFYGYQCEGLDANGKYIFTDITPDGKIDDKDQTYIGSPQPKLTYSINNSLTYKKWDLSIFFRGVYGNKVLNYSRMSFATTQWLLGGNVLREALSSGLTDSPIYSSFYIEDGSFIRLETVNLGYTFKAESIKWVKNLRFYVSGQNLFKITKYKGLDPEVDMSGLNPGVEGRNYYPKSRTIMLGVNISF